ncbi:MAG: flagellar biosynthesis protein FlhA [Pseudomonas sp.]|uniref:flagellar biosynthesis protein FlhA n=1 Tax=Stenotrophomonas sp. TaxID=69392 RepID=UPI003D6CB141
MNPFLKLKGQSDLALVFAVLSILLILFMPIPSAALDFLILVNFAFALTMLLMTFYVPRPVDFSTFPSLLLIATLFRLSLNIAATRLILSGAEAGQVIGSIGKFVVNDNFIIGLIVFFILIVVQYVVVTNGAQRVSEVAARFVLDAMPGQQMSIDADLNMGLIDQDEARRRRKDLEKEAGFYGSMDGASKFVKGDAIAGIIILLINVIGGLSVGVAQMDMSWGDAARVFTLLTIGDGIVTQVPALVISVATGIIVTRSASDNRLSLEVVRQLSSHPKIQLLVMIALGGLLLLPGMPKWPVIILAGIAAAIWLSVRRKAAAVAGQQAGTAEEITSAAQRTHVAVSPIEVVFGAGLGKAWMPLQLLLSERLANIRKQYAQDMGMMVPPIVFRDDPQLGTDEYRILLFGDRYAGASLQHDMTLAIHSNEKAAGQLPGTPTKDPAFGLPAVWIAAEHITQARALGYTPVDAMTVFTTHVTEVMKEHASMLLLRSEVLSLLDGVRARQPGLVEELVPNILALSDIQQVLQGLLEESVSIRNIDLIIEVLVDKARHEKDAAKLGEAIRQRLSHSICRNIQGNREVLPVLTLDPAIEGRMMQNLHDVDGSGGFVLDPHLAEGFLGRLLAQIDLMMRKNTPPVMLCRPELRRALRTFTRRVAPRLSVISMSEVPHSITLSSFATITVESISEAKSSNPVFPAR